MEPPPPKRSTATFGPAWVCNLHDPPQDDAVQVCPMPTSKPSDFNGRDDTIVFILTARVKFFGVPFSS